MVTVAPVRPAVTVLGILFFLTSCGGGSHLPVRDASPALAPSGATATTVSYECRGGRRSTITVSLPDPRRLPEVFNPINVCEYDGGLASIKLAVSCDGGPTASPVRVLAVKGELPTTTGRLLCGT